jgi:glyoxalase family protein
MKLEGIHHVTCITGDILKNVDFYTRVLGLRLVAKSVNQDDPSVYHVFYSDEQGAPGADLTFFEYQHAARGRPGPGMVHRVIWRVGSTDALAFWARRLANEGVTAQRQPERLIFADPEGLEHELQVDTSADEPLIADHPEIPRELALRGFDGVRAYGSPRLSGPLLEEVLGATEVAPGTWELRGRRRGGTIALETAPAGRGFPGAGTVHHVAWGTTVADHGAWLEHLRDHEVDSTPIIDRYFFHSIYFREPSGVLFEIADDGPGFARDGDLEHLGRRLSLPPWLEPRRAEIEARLTPIPDPRARWKGVHRA